LSRHQYEKHKYSILTGIHQAIHATLDTNPINTTAQHFANIQRAIQKEIEKNQKPPSNIRRKAWCNPQIKRMIHKQHALYRNRQRNKTAVNTQKHATFRNKLNRKIKEEKKKDFTGRLEKAKQNPKQQAKILKSIISKNKQARESPTTIRYEDKIYTKPIDIANALNDHFITIGKKIFATIPHRQDQSNSIMMETSKHPQFTLRHN